MSSSPKDKGKTPKKFQNLKTTLLPKKQYWVYFYKSGVRSSFKVLEA